MARNLIAADCDLTVWNRTKKRALDFAASTGCKHALTPADLMSKVDIVITMLADDAASDAVHCGKDGLFSGGGAKILIEMGTISPDHITALCKNAPSGVIIVDAPVSGATQAAQDAALLIMAGCTQKAVPQIAPVFDALGRKTIYLGQSGAGAAMKLVVNSLIHGMNQTLAEAMTLAEASGIAPDVAFDVIEASAACAPMMKYRRPLYLDEDKHDVTFTVSLACKDMQLASHLAEAHGVAMPQAATTLAQLNDAVNAGFGARDMASMLSFMRKDSQ